MSEAPAPARRIDITTAVRSFRSPTHTPPATNTSIFHRHRILTFYTHHNIHRAESYDLVSTAPPRTTTPSHRHSFRHWQHPAAVTASRHHVRRARSTLHSHEGAAGRRTGPAATSHVVLDSSAAATAARLSATQRVVAALQSSGRNAAPAPPIQCDQPCEQELSIPYSRRLCAASRAEQGAQPAQPAEVQRLAADERGRSDAELAKPANAGQHTPYQKRTAG